MHFSKAVGVALVLLSASAGTAFAQEHPIGIPVCDNFIAGYQACVSTQVPEAQRPMLSGPVEQWRTSWRQLAANPQTRGTLEQVCRHQLESIRQDLQQAYGCRF